MVREFKLNINQQKIIALKCVEAIRNLSQYDKNSHGIRVTYGTVFEISWSTPFGSRMNHSSKVHKIIRNILVEEGISYSKFVTYVSYYTKRGQERRSVNVIIRKLYVEKRRCNLG